MELIIAQSKKKANVAILKTFLAPLWTYQHHFLLATTTCGYCNLDLVVIKQRPVKKAIWQGNSGMILWFFLVFCGTGYF